MKDSTRDSRSSCLGPCSLPWLPLKKSIGALVVISVLVALIRWMLVPPRRFYGPEITGHVRLDAALILVLILMIMVSMFGTNATRMVLTGKYSRRPLRLKRTGSRFRRTSRHRLWFEFFWWTHILVVLGFLNYLPYSKHLHVLTSIPNVFFASLEPRGALSRLNLEDENAEKFGVDDVQDLTLETAARWLYLHRLRTVHGRLSCQRYRQAPEPAKNNHEYPGTHAGKGSAGAGRSLRTGCRDREQETPG